MNDLRTAAQEFVTDYENGDLGDLKHYARALRAALEVDDAAAELRRLHAENERLHQINQSHEMKLSVRGYETQIDDLRLAHAELHALNGELLEALKLAVRQNEHDMLMTGEELRICDAAIARAEEKV